MFRFTSLVAVVAILLSLTTGCQRTASQAVASDAADSKPSVPSVPLLDREDDWMQEAIRNARRDVDRFLTALQSPHPEQSNFAIKVAFSEGHFIEHMWLVDLQYDSGMLIGKLANTPELVKGVEAGASYATTPEELSDWYFFDRGNLVGGYTLPQP